MGFESITFDGKSYGSFSELVGKNTWINFRSIVNRAYAFKGTTLAKGENQASFNYKGRKVVVVFDNVDDRCRKTPPAPVKKVVKAPRQKARPQKAPQITKSSIAEGAEFASLKATVRELQKSQIRNAARFKILEAENFAMKTSLIALKREIS